MISDGANIYTWWTPTSNLVTVLTQFLAVCRLISFASYPSRMWTSTTEGERSRRVLIFIPGGRRSIATSNLVTVLTQFLAVCRLISFTGVPRRANDLRGC
jgi:hypothetical protein